MVLVAFDHATVRQDDLRPEQLVAGQTVLPAENPQPSAEGEACDSDGGAAARGDGQAMLGQPIVEITEPYAGADGRYALRPPPSAWA